MTDIVSVLDDYFDVDIDKRGSIKVFGNRNEIYRLKILQILKYVSWLVRIELRKIALGIQTIFVLIFENFPFQVNVCEKFWASILHATAGARELSFDSRRVTRTQAFVYGAENWIPKYVECSMLTLYTLYHIINVHLI